MIIMLEFPIQLARIDFQTYCALSLPCRLSLVVQ